VRTCDKLPACGWFVGKVIGGKEKFNEKERKENASANFVVEYKRAERMDTTSQPVAKKERLHGQVVTCLSSATFGYTDWWLLLEEDASSTSPLNPQPKLPKQPKQQNPSAQRTKLGSADDLLKSIIAAAQEEGGQTSAQKSVFEYRSGMATSMASFDEHGFVRDTKSGTPGSLSPSRARSFKTPYLCMYASEIYYEFVTVFGNTYINIYVYIYIH